MRREEKKTDKHFKRRHDKKKELRTIIDRPNA